MRVDGRHDIIRHRPRVPDGMSQCRQSSGSGLVTTPGLSLSSKVTGGHPSKEILKVCGKPDPAHRSTALIGLTATSASLKSSLILRRASNLDASTRITVSWCKGFIPGRPRHVRPRLLLASHPETWTRK